MEKITELHNELAKVDMVRHIPEYTKKDHLIDFWYTHGLFIIYLSLIGLLILYFKLS